MLWASGICKQIPVQVYVIYVDDADQWQSCSTDIVGLEIMD